MTRSNKNNGRKKKDLVFDQQKRKEYLTGFRKRKQERRAKAKETLERQVEAAKKRIKQEIKDDFKDNFKRSFAPIPELENSDDEDLNQQEYETDEVTVKIVELSTSDLATQNNWIGENKPIYLNRNSNTDTVQNNVERETDVDMNEIKGMELVPKIMQPNSVVAASGTTAGHDLQSPNDNNKKFEFKSKRDIGINVEKTALKALQQSKIFQTKKKLDRLKDKKKARMERNKRISIQKKLQKKRGGKIKKKNYQRTKNRKKR